MRIDNDREGWYYAEAIDRSDGDAPESPKLARCSTYDEIKALALADGHKIQNGGWKHKLLMWNWHGVSLDRYPGWQTEIVNGRSVPGFVKLEHTHKRGESSCDLSNAWDDVAEVDFYSRDFSLDGSVFVNDGDRYDSGWWFRTLAERDRFVAWATERGAMVADMTKAVP